MLYIYIYNIMRPSKLHDFHFCMNNSFKHFSSKSTHQLRWLDSKERVRISGPILNTSRSDRASSLWFKCCRSLQRSSDMINIAEAALGGPLLPLSLFICLLQAPKYILKCLGHVPSWKAGVRERLADRRHAFHASREWSLTPCCHDVCVCLKSQRERVYLAMFWA